MVTGNYSRLACEIQFVRSMGYYLIQIYIPSGLIVIISWVSFWLNRNATPARVSLGVTTVLTMTTLMSSTNAALPKISYVKSIDVYLGTCFVMVFASLLGNKKVSDDWFVAVLLFIYLMWRLKYMILFYLSTFINSWIILSCNTLCKKVEIKRCVSSNFQIVIIKVHTILYMILPFNKQIFIMLCGYSYNLL